MSIFVTAPRMLGGVPAEEGQFPWHADILVISPDSGWSCNGALISDQAILTEAACVYG